MILMMGVLYLNISSTLAFISQLAVNSLEINTMYCRSTPAAPIKLALLTAYVLYLLKTK